MQIDEKRGREKIEEHSAEQSPKSSRVEMRVETMTAWIYPSSTMEKKKTYYNNILLIYNTDMSDELYNDYIMCTLY